MIRYDKILVRKRRLTKENDRYKLYLPRKYDDIWGRLCEEGKRVDFLLILKY